MKKRNMKMKGKISSMSSMASSVSGWACLPKDIIDLFLNHILKFRDFIRFCSVCQSWRSVALDSHSQINGLRRQHHQNLHLLKTCRNKFPMLVLKPQHIQEKSKRTLFSVTEGTFYDIQLPMPYPRQFVGSSRGWLFTIDYNSMIITLVNPFLNEMFSLPPLNVDGPIERAKLLFDKGRNNYEVLVVYFQGLAYFNSKTLTWITITRPLNDQSNVLFLDIISYNGKIYSISCSGDLITVDFHRRNFTDVATVPVDMGQYFHENWLVESQEGDLILVRRYPEFRPNHSKPDRRCIEVYKLLHFRGKKGPGHLDFVRISSIGEQALFLSDRECMSISTRDFPICKPNCIYHDRGCVEISEIQQGKSVGNPHTGEECFGSPNPSNNPLSKAIWVVPYFKT